MSNRFHARLSYHELLSIVTIRNQSISRSILFCFPGMIPRVINCRYVLCIPRAIISVVLFFSYEAVYPISERT